MNVMPSPFPGMDPWLENPKVWPDFHDRLAEQISSTLNRNLPSHYYAQLGVREELGIVGRTTIRQIVPDVSIQSTQWTPKRDRQSDGGVAVADAPRDTVTSSWEIDIVYDKQSISFVEIRDSRSGHEVVTLIEILSPSNKGSGPDHEKYVKKRNEFLESKTSFIEIDLLRAGRRDFFGPDVHQRLYQFDPPMDYLAFVQRSWRRAEGVRYQLFGSRIQDLLPVIAIPLRESEPESTLDLQYAFQETYDRGPYRRGAVDYNEPADPPLPEGVIEWAQKCLKNETAR